MTDQTVSISNVKGGMALDGEEAAALADLLEWTASRSPDSALHMRGRARLLRLIRVLRGKTPIELGEFA